MYGERARGYIHVLGGSMQKWSSRGGGTVSARNTPGKPKPYIT